MNINFKIKEAPEGFGLKHTNVISDVYKYMINELNNLCITIDNNYKEHYKEIDFPDSVDINIIFVDGNKAFNFYFDEEVAQQTYGVFNITNGDGFLGEDYLAKEFTVLIDASDETFDSTYKKDSGNNKIDFISRYLVTMTHEIQHALEFIENSGGLTPHQVEDLFDNEVFDYSVNDCSTGYGIPQYFDDFEGVQDEDEVYQIMEERVELKGRKMFNDLNIPLHIINTLNKDIKKSRKLKI